MLLEQMSTLRPLRIECHLPLNSMLSDLKSESWPEAQCSLSNTTRSQSEARDLEMAQSDEIVSVLVS